MSNASNRAKFAGKECAACCEVFSDTDDVVVCPECGTPHHRTCYSENGECVNTFQHERMRLLDGAVDALRASEQQRVMRQINTDFYQFHEDNVAAVKEKDRDFEEPNLFGVSKAELSAFMQIEPQSAEYENKIVQYKVVNFNVFAGLLSPFYQFYQGMRTLGFTMMFLIFLFPFMPFSVGLMLLFNDYIYLRSCAFKIKMFRRVYAGMPPEIQNEKNYYDFLKEQGRRGVFRGLFDTLFAFILLLVLAHYFGVEPFMMPLNR
jgi:hypothetical protein